MPEVFADTGYWIAIVSPRDNLHDRAMAVSKTLGARRIVTSDMVLVELLNAFAKRGDYLRKTAAGVVRDILGDRAIIVIPQTRTLFMVALLLYEERPDQSWSLTDCASLHIMQTRGITEALAYDEHFTQMGFTPLLR